MQEQKKLKKREGSSLVIVLMVFTVLLLTSSIVMNVVSTGVKLRGMEKNRVENIYGAESGITLAQAAVEKTFQTATIVAQRTATSNDEFQAMLRNFIGTGLDDNKYVLSAENLAYYQETGQTPVSLVPNTQGRVLTILDSSYQNGENEQWSFRVQSDFEDDKGLMRRVQADFNITMPEWDGNAMIETPDATFLKKHLMIADGDLTLAGDSLVINGGVYVKGNQPTTTPTVAEQAVGNIDLASKYHGGILNQAKSVVFKENVVTNRSFINSGNLEIGDSLFAQNIFIQNPQQTESSLKIKDVVVDNDLVVNTSEKAAVTIENFYGINDKTIETVGHQRSSSSIIVNQPNSKATLNVTNQAYIAGTAFIDLAKPYQTGESVAVTGNYLVYTLPVSKFQTICQTEQPIIGKCEQLVYEYVEPLQLITGTKITPQAELQEWTTQQKATYFTQIAQAVTQTEIQLKHGNVTLPPNTVAAGAIVQQKTDGTVEVLQPTGSLQTALAKQKDYANEVYRMGLASPEEDLQKLYDKPRTDNQSEDIWTVTNNVVDFTKGIATTAEALVYNPDAGKTVVVTSSQNSCSATEICVLAEQDSKKIIITAGDVVFRNFTTANMAIAIVSGQNVNFEASVGQQNPENPVVLNKLTEEDLTKILKQYAFQLQGVFRNNSNQTGTEGETNTGGTGEQNYYDADLVIKVTNWQLKY